MLVDFWLGLTFFSQLPRFCDVLCLIPMAVVIAVLKNSNKKGIADDNRKFTCTHTVTVLMGFRKMFHIIHTNGYSLC